MDNICDLLLEHFVNHSTSIAFPELIFPVCLRVGLFISLYVFPRKVCVVFPTSNKVIALVDETFYSCEVTAS